MISTEQMQIEAAINRQEYTDRHAIKMSFLDAWGEERSITLVRWFVKFQPENTKELSVEQQIAQASMDAEATELLLLQNYERIWSTYQVWYYASLRHIYDVRDKIRKNWVGESN